ncbi:PAS domain S-box protein [bacterium]|nr:PAS domain S-box protein [bacterium]
MFLVEKQVMGDKENLINDDLNIYDSTIRELFQRIDVGVIIIDNDYTIHFVNKRICQMFGYAEHELVGNINYENLFDEQGKRAVQEKKENRTQKFADPFEIKIRKKDGLLYPIEVSGMAITNSQNKVVGSIELFYDVTEKKQNQLSLKASEYYAKQIIDSSLDMIIAVDSNRLIVEFNKAAQSVFGYSREEVIGKHASLLYADQDNANLVKKHLSEFNYWKGEVFNKKKNGTIFISFLTTTVMHDCSNNVIGYMGISRDITDKKRKDEYITTLSSAIHHTADSVIITDTNGIIEYVNPSFESLTGYSKQEVLGKKPNVLKSGKQPSQYYKTMWKTLLSGKVFRSELINKKKNGILFYEEITITPIIDDGKATHFVSTGRNITDRKHAEKKLKEYARLLDLTTDAIIVTTDTGQITFWNNGAEMVYGFKAKEALGCQFHELIATDPELYAIARQTVQQKGTWSGDFLQTTRHQKQLTIFSRWVAVQDMDNEDLSILLINTDVTESRKMELDLQRSRHMESLGTLAGGLAHDLNNLLTPVLMSIDMLKHKPSSDLLNSLESYVFRAIDLVKQVLFFARNESKSVAFCEVDLKNVIHEAYEVLAKTLPGNITFNILLKNDFSKIYGNFTQLFQVFMNLFSNAIGAMPHGGALNVSIDDEIKKNGEHVIVVSISDNGMGISNEHIDKIFDPFFTTKPKSKGTGLGLPIAYSIVKKHNGSLSVVSEVGKGSTFQIRFPLTKHQDAINFSSRKDTV